MGSYFRIGTFSTLTSIAVSYIGMPQRRSCAVTAEVVGPAGRPWEVLATCFGSLVNVLEQIQAPRDVDMA